MQATRLRIARSGWRIDSPKFDERFQCFEHFRSPAIVQHDCAGKEVHAFTSAN